MGVRSSPTAYPPRVCANSAIAATQHPVLDKQDPTYIWSVCSWYYKRVIQSREWWQEGTR